MLQNAVREVDVQRHLRFLFARNLSANTIVALLFPEFEEARVSGPIKEVEILGELIHLSLIEDACFATLQ